MTHSEQPTPLRQTQEAEYIDRLKQSFSEIANHLELEPTQKKFLETRWLDQVLWMEDRANRFRNLYHTLQRVVVIGGVIIPALVSLTALGGCSSFLGGAENNQSNTSDEIELNPLRVCNAGFGIVTFLLSQAVAICAASEQLFKYGERWRHYRRNVELLKSHGWQFIELTGPYAPYALQKNYPTQKRHQEAFRAFVSHVEEILQRDVDLYINQIAEQQAKNQKLAMDKRLTELENRFQTQEKQSADQSDDGNPN